MFWVYLLIVVAVFVGLVGWFGRKRGSARGTPNADIQLNTDHLRDRIRGDFDRY